MVICVQLSEEVYRQKNINKEVQELQEEIEKVEKDNKELKQLVQYFNTEEFKEKEAKEKLNLVKEGEKVVVVKKASTENAVAEKQPDKPEVSLNRPNYYWWWHYFFNLEV